MEWLVGALLTIAGSITGWFIERDALNFVIVQMVMAVLLFTSMVFIVAFWPSLKSWLKHNKG